MNFDNKIVKSGTLRKLEVIERLTTIGENIQSQHTTGENVAIATMIQTIAGVVDGLDTPDTGLVINGDGISINNCMFQGLDMGVQVQGSNKPVEEAKERYYDPCYDHDVEDVPYPTIPKHIEISDEEREAIQKAVGNLGTLDQYMCCDGMNDPENMELRNVDTFMGRKVKPVGTLPNAEDKIIICRFDTEKSKTQGVEHPIGAIYTVLFGVKDDPDTVLVKESDNLVYAGQYYVLA